MNARRTLKAAFAALLAALMALAVFPVSALPAQEAEKSPVAPCWTVPDGYNEHDYNKLAAFLEQTNSSGVKNGARLGGGYNPNVPDTWKGITWITVDGEKRVYEVSISNRNVVGTLNLSGCTNLEGLYCMFNKLSKLNVSGCTNLSKLECYDNKLTKLNVSGCTNLERLWCADNRLTGLNVSGCIKLSNLDCWENRLTTLDVSANIYLSDLSCCYNSLTELDVSANTNLRWLLCYGNSLTELNVSGCTNLEMLECPDNKFTELDVSACTNLNRLNCSYNNLTELDVSACTNLEELVCVENSLTKLNVTGCTKLEELSCSSNNLTELDVIGCTNLQTLKCNTNNLTELDVSGCTNLQTLECSFNNLTELDVSGCTNLSKLKCYINRLTELDVSGFTKLEELSCSSNKLTELDVTGCTNLEMLECYSNRLTELDVSGCTNLQTLECSFNNLTELDVSGCTNLSKLLCHDNSLTELDLSNNPGLLLDHIYAEGNGLIGYEKEYTTPRVYAYPAEGATFEGFYNESGELLSNGAWNSGSNTYSFYFNNATGTVIARFSGGPLSAPANVSASVIDGKPVINWDAVEGAASYQVWRMKAGGVYVLVGTVEDTSFTDNDTLTLLATYYYRIKAVDADGNAGEFSEAVSVTPYVLKAPKGVSASLVERKPVVTWSASANATGYEVWRAPKGGTYELVAAASGTSFTDMDELVPLKKYYYKVRAFDDHGSFSAFSSRTMITAYGVATPADAAASIVEGKPVVTWSAAVNATGYEIWRAKKGGTYELVGTVSGTSFTDNDELVPLKKYYYKVRAFDDYGNESEFSSKTYVIAYGLTVPKGINAAIIECSPLVAWDAVTYATGYQVWRAKKGGTYELVGTVSDTSFTDTDELVTNKAYYYKVKAIDDYGNESAFSARVRVVIP